MAGSFEHRAGNAGERPATRTAELPASMSGRGDCFVRPGDSVAPYRVPRSDSGAQRAAGADQNSRPTPRAGFAAGGRDGRGAREARYLDTPLATSSHRVYRGRTEDGVILHRKSVRKRILETLVNSLVACGLNVDAKRLSECGKWFKCGRCPEGGTALLPNPCNSKLCVTCAVRKAAVLIARILLCCNRRGKRYWFLTLTDVRVSSLSPEYVTGWTESFAKLRRSKAWGHVKHSATGWLGVTGGVYSVESVYSRESRSWNTHIHALIELPKDHPDEWLDALKAAWFAIRPTSRNLHLERVYYVTKRGRKKYNRVTLQALKEVVKYVTKAADFCALPDLVAEFMRAYENVRRVQCFGSFQGALKDEAREPGDDGMEITCSLGHRHCQSDFEWSSRAVPISDTELKPDGTRQLKFDFWAEVAGSVEESPPNFELMRQVVESYKQQRIEFSGALPEKVENGAPLFADVA